MPAPTIPRPLWRRLRRIRPSRDGSLDLRPCRVLLKEGRWIDRVYLVEEETYLRHWRVPPGEDPSRRPLALEAIEEIAESPSRLPVRFADRLYRAGESGKGYTVFTLLLASGRRLPYRTGHAVDFPQWPDDVTPDLVVDAHPHEAPREFRQRRPAPHESAAPHAWCLYRRPPSRLPLAAAACWTIATWAGAAVLADLARAALGEAAALRFLAELVRGIASRGEGALTASLWGAAVALQAGLFLAPLLIRRSRCARLVALGLVLPALALAPAWVRTARLVRWAGEDPRAQTLLALALFCVPVANALLLLWPRGRRAAEAREEPAGEEGGGAGGAGIPQVAAPEPGAAP